MPCDQLKLWPAMEEAGEGGAAVTRSGAPRGRLGVRRGLAWSISAAAPAATGVAIEVPLSVIIRRPAAGLTPASSSGWVVTMRFPSASALVSLLPGATR